MTNQYSTELCVHILSNLIKVIKNDKGPQVESVLSALALSARRFCLSERGQIYMINKLRPFKREWAFQQAWPTYRSLPASGRHTTLRENTGRPLISSTVCREVTVYFDCVWTGPPAVSIGWSCTFSTGRTAVVAWHQVTEECSYFI